MQTEPESHVLHVSAILSSSCTWSDKLNRACAYVHPYLSSLGAGLSAHAPPPSHVVSRRCGQQCCHNDVYCRAVVHKPDLPLADHPFPSSITSTTSLCGTNGRIMTGLEHFNGWWQSMCYMQLRACTRFSCCWAAPAFSAASIIRPTVPHRFGHVRPRALLALEKRCPRER